ncbi:VWA domain-containing protein [Magnetovirga frankeli]|jgi:Ca-activated chloride channel family protein|uniref:vWA domain-containing protein n=1 Tax=Magnetovirga frankeli TaxID=947516 RepID=UPI001292D147|nr:VWA domain-containing protein [gamma proteobacterium SS-5]
MPSDISLHFSQPLWLLALVMPLGVWLWLRLTVPRHDTARYRAYADVHLLPQLLGLQSEQGRGRYRRFVLWTLLWTLLVLALAGPRWDYRDIQLFRPGSDLVVLLDLSRSMDVADVSPSRLARARQEIEDLIGQNRQARIGLIAFATLPHVVAPLTEDAHALRQQLPALSTDLVQLQGSRLPEALLRAQQMLAGQPDDSSRHLLLISDGDFGLSPGEQALKELRLNNIRLHVLGIGSPEGGPVPGPDGVPLRDGQGEAVISRLDEAALQQLAEQGGGIYRRADYRASDTADILQRIGQDARAEVVAQQKTRVWNERFYLPLFLLMLLLLPRFRRHHRQQEARR